METMPDDLIDVEDEDGTVRTILWPHCIVPGCLNRICRSKGSAYFCHPHTEALERLIANAVSDLENADAR